MQMQTKGNDLYPKKKNTKPNPAKISKTIMLKVKHILFQSYDLIYQDIVKKTICCFPGLNITPCHYLLKNITKKVPKNAEKMYQN